MTGPPAATAPRRRVLLATLAGAALSRLRPGHAEELRMVVVPDATRATLLAQARALGRLPIIVGLAASPQADPGVARSRLLEDLGVVPAADGNLAGPGITNVKQFETIPFLALTVEPTALERLLNHPSVDSVQVDAAAPPL